MLTRKEFIQQALAVSAGTAVMGFSSLDEKWLKTFSPSAPVLFPSFDLHAHPGRFYQRGRTEGYTGDDVVRKTVNEMNATNLSGVFLSMVVDGLVTKATETGIVPSRDFEKGEAWKEYKRQLVQLNELCKLLPLQQATKFSDLKPDSKTVAAFFACEGGDFLESSDQLDEMYADGIRSIQLVHYAPNPLGDLQTYDSQHNGLSITGKTVVKKMNQLGMVIDVAHASYKTVRDVVEITNKPIILSHSILKAKEERPISLRAITPEHAKAVAQTGGVIGAWPSGFNTSFEDYVDNILKLTDIVGIDHVGLGTDMDSNFKPVLDSYSQLSRLAESLQAKGFSNEELQKFMGGNAIRVLKKVF